MKTIIINDGEIYRVKDNLAKEIQHLIETMRENMDVDDGSFEFEECKKMIIRIKNEGKFIDTVYTNIRL
jgi:hypothetical protein